MPFLGWMFYTAVIFGIGLMTGVILARESERNNRG